MLRPMRITILGSMALALLAAGCGNDDKEGGGANGKTPDSPQLADELMVLCGSSFRAPMENLAKQFEDETGTKVLLSFGGSEDHLPNVEKKSAGDLYVSHTPYMQKTEKAGSLLRQVEVGFLAPVLVTTKGNPKKLKQFEDLATEGLRLVLPDPNYSTCGEMVAALLEKKGIKEAVAANVGNAMVRHHSMVGNQIQLGSRDAGIMWNGVANEFKDKIDVIPLPYEYETEIHVAVMGLSYTKEKPTVEAFLDFVEKHGPAVFAEYGYVK